MGEPEQAPLATEAVVGERQHRRHRLAGKAGTDAPSLLEHHDPTVGERLDRSRPRERGHETVGEAGGDGGRRHRSRRAAETTATGTRVATMVRIVARRMSER